MTTYELARVLLAAPETEARALVAVEVPGATGFDWISLTAYVLDEDDVEYQGLTGQVAAGQLLITETGDREELPA